jgi:hypothetical protein
MPRAASRAAAVAAVLGVALILNTSAASASSGCDLPLGVTFLACPGASLCVGVVPYSRSVWVADPLNAAPWVQDVIDWDGIPQSISCPSVSFCAVTDNVGDLATSTNPRKTQASWKLGHLDLATATGVNEDSLVALEDVSCLSVSFCVAVDARGHVLTSSDPGGAVNAWRTADVDGTNLLGWVAWASPSLCVALDDDGNLVTSTHPAASRAAWTRGRIDNNDGGGF